VFEIIMYLHGELKYSLSQTDTYCLDKIFYKTVATLIWQIISKIGETLKITWSLTKIKVAIVK